VQPTEFPPNGPVGVGLAHVLTRYVRATYLNRALLHPVPPGSGKDEDSRWIDDYENMLDEEQIADWIRQS